MTLREDKGSELTYSELDSNFIYLDNKNAISVDANPTSGDDESKGFIVGSEWLNLDTQIKYRCSDNTADSAVWDKIIYGITTIVELEDTFDELKESSVLVTNADGTAVTLAPKSTFGILLGLDEGNGVGYIRSIRDPDYFRDIGKNAFDFSFSDDDNDEMGAGGKYSSAFGFNNKTNRPYDFIVGSENISLCDEEDPDYGNNIICGTENEITTDKGLGNVVGGGSNKVSNYSNIVGGGGNEVSKAFNVVGGRNNKVSNYRNIVGGYSNTVSESDNIVGGHANTISSDRNIVGGDDNTVSESDNIVGGYSNTIEDRYIIASGKYNKSSNNEQIITGHYNDNTNTNTALMIGNGTSDDNRSNLIELNTDGVIYIDKMVGVTDDRPSLSKASSFSYFDTDLGKPIWYNGSDWVDATGAVV